MFWIVREKKNSYQFDFEVNEKGSNEVKIDNRLLFVVFSNSISKLREVGD